PNRYNYAGQSAIMKFDPSGLLELLLCDFSSGNGLHACEQAYNRCQKYSEQLYDKGYETESNTLFRECRKSRRDCYRNEDAGQRWPGNAEAVPQFPPNKNENGGGYVGHYHELKPTYFPPSTDPITPLPPKPPQ